MTQTHQIEPTANQVQYFQWSDASDSGFIIRREPDLDPSDTQSPWFKAEEWRNGDIVDATYGSYATCEAWTEHELPAHRAWRKHDEDLSP